MQARAEHRPQGLETTHLPTTYRPTYPPAYLPTDRPMYRTPTDLPVYLPTYLPAYLPTYPYPPPHVPTCLPACLPANLPSCLPACLPAYLPTYLPLYLPSHPPTYTVTQEVLGFVWLAATHQLTPHRKSNDLARAKGLGSAMQCHRTRTAKNGRAWCKKWWTHTRLHILADAILLDFRAPGRPAELGDHLISKRHTVVATGSEGNPHV